MKLGLAIEDAQDAEHDVFDELTTIAQRHAADGDVYHVARTLAARCASQLELLAPHASRYGATVRSIDEPEGQDPGVLERVRQLASELSGRQGPAGMDLFDDLRSLYLTAHRSELAWAVLTQVAQAARDAELLAAAKKGRDEAERRWKWVRTKVKDASPQLFVAG